MKVETIKLYEGRDDVTLTTYLLDDSKEMLKGGVRPAILVNPGGAYCFCSDREAEPIAIRYAAMGYHAFVLRYSVYNKGVMVNPMGDLKLDEDSLFPNAICDAGAAMLYIKDHAKEWLVDPDQIYLTGFSAGAHNSAMYCTHWDAAFLQDRFHRPAEDFKPAGALLGYGYYDWEDFRKQEVTDPMQRAMNESIDFSYFGTRTPSADQLRQASPALHVTKNTPPMFLWTTCGDRTLPSEQTMIMGAALAKAGISYEVHTFETGDHGLAVADQSSAANWQQVNDDVAQWFPMAQKWLRRHAPIDMPKEEAPFDPSVLFGDK